MKMFFNCTLQHLNINNSVAFEQMPEKSALLFEGQHVVKRLATLCVMTSCFQMQ